MVLEEGLKYIVGKKVPTDEVLKSGGEERTAIGSVVQRRSNMVGHVLRHSNWLNTLVEGMTEGRGGRGKPRQVYMDGAKEGRRYVAIKRLSTQRKKFASSPGLWSLG